MIDFDFENLCYSCSLCQNACPTGAITSDNELKPQINKAKCIDCGICEQKCISINKENSRNQNDRGYIAKNKNDQIRKNSSSGGVFFSTAKWILNQDGYVCGCIYDDQMLPKHLVSNNLSDVRRMMGSKYVTSDMNSSISEIISVLKEEKPVLFSGVPCQCEAIHRGIPQELKGQLYIISMVCHGTIYRKIWSDYLVQETKRYGDIISVTMRNKDRGWANYGLSFKFADGKEHTTYRNENGFFLRAYTSGLFERARCLNCEYKGERIAADLILGDGWGMDELYPQFTDEMGVSVILSRNDKGTTILKAISEEVDLVEVETRNIYACNQRIISPAPPNIDWEDFNKKIKASPEQIERICEKYCNSTNINRLRRKIKQTIRHNVSVSRRK